MSGRFAVPAFLVSVIVTLVLDGGRVAEAAIATTSVTQSAESVELTDGYPVAHTAHAPAEVPLPAHLEHVVRHLTQAPLLRK